MAITGSLNVKIVSARIQLPASAATEFCAVVRCGKQRHATPKIRDTSTWNTSFTFSLKEESETQTIIIEVFYIDSNANDLLGSARIPLFKATESEMGASRYALVGPNQERCGDVNVAFQFSSSAMNGSEYKKSSSFVGETATTNQHQPPKGYPQQKNGPQEIENERNSNEKLGNTQSKERGLNSFFSHGSHGWTPGYNYNYNSCASPPHYEYPPRVHVGGYGSPSAPCAPTYHAAYQGPYGHGPEYHEEYSSYEHSGHGHGHGHYGHQMGPPFYPLHNDHGHQHHHY